MARNVEFYQSHLDRVSRSFAFCIRQLPEPLREWVSLSYLLCRVLDTIEDSSWPSPAVQSEAYQRFDRALLNVASKDLLEPLRSDAHATPDEDALLTDSPALFEDLHNLPEPVRRMIQDLVGTMSRGMQHFSQSRVNGRLSLKTLSEVNQYCFFVAGVVGELLTKLLGQVTGAAISQSSLLKAHHFGLFLQKVNLLKDQVSDEREGRHLIPSRTLVEDSARQNAEQAFEFLGELPGDQPEFKRFCAWSLFLGLESLVVARQSRGEDKVLKVGRQRTEEIIAEVEQAFSESGSYNRRLLALYLSAAERLGWAGEAPEHSASPTVPDWLTRLYHGPLSHQSLGALGMS